MILYLSGADKLNLEDCEPSTKVGKLFTFASSKKMLSRNLENSTNCKVFMDSGAFSVYHSGAKVDIDDYINYINNNDQVDVWAQLDVIPYPELNSETAKASGEGSWNQYLYVMERLNDDKRDKFIPIYHFGEPYECLLRMLETEVNGRVAPYIGIGGRHGVSKKAHEVYYNSLFDIIKNSKNPNVKIHAFGMTVTDLLDKFPFYSADSTTWLQMSVNGWILTECCGPVKVSEKHKGKRDSFWGRQTTVQNIILSEVEKYSGDFELLTKDYDARSLFNINYFIRWVNKHSLTYNKNTRRKLF